jgi:hypothetical protein
MHLKPEHINLIDVVYASMSEVIQVIKTLEQKLRVFVICDDCFWVASAIDADRFDASSCPSCSTRISFMPLAVHDGYSYTFDEGRSIDFHSTK